MNNLRLLLGLLFIALASCGTVQNKYQIESDDAYFSRKESNTKNIIIPNVDVNKIMQEYPSKIKEGTFDNRPSITNSNAASAYAKYRSDTDSIYKYNPQLASNYNPYKAPVFDEREEARKQRRLNRIYNNNNRRIYYGNNSAYGYNRYNNYSSGWGMGLGFNLFNGFSTGFGYNNGWGFNTTWNNGYNNYYNPFNIYGCANNYYGYNPYNYYNGYGYNPYYNGYNYYHQPYYQPVIIDNKTQAPAPANHPRVMVGSDVPPANNGTIITPNMPRAGQLMEMPNNNQPSTPANNGAATLRQNQNGIYQYTPPANYNAATGSTEAPVNTSQYTNYDRNINNNAAPVFRNDNNVMPQEQRNNNYQQAAPQYENRQFQQADPGNSRSSYSAPTPSFQAPAAPRIGGGGGGGSMSHPRL